MAKADSNAEKWVVLKFPAIMQFDELTSSEDPRKEGEPLWPNKYDLDKLNKIKTSVGSYDWNALFQQRPAPTGGGMIKTHWWRYWKPKGIELPPVTVKLESGEYANIEAVDLPETFDEMIQSWDFTFKNTNNSDFVAGGVWERNRQINIYLTKYMIK